MPYTVQTTFGPSAVTPRHDEYLLKHGNAHGVRGLKKGEYTLQVNRAKTYYSVLEISWWRYGTKEENLEPAKKSGVSSSSTGLGDSEQPSPLVLDVNAIPVVDFSVVE